MIRFAALFLFAATAVAQTPTLSLELTAPSSARAGQRITVEARVSSDRPVNGMFFQLNAIDFFVESVSAPGWTCGNPGEHVSCSYPSLTGGAAPVITITALAPNSNGPIDVDATINATGANGASATRAVTVTPAATAADLSLLSSSVALPVGTRQIPIAFEVRNPSDAHTGAVHVRIQLDMLAAGTPSLVSPGWQCHASGASQVDCSIPSMPARSTSTLSFEVAGPGGAAAISAFGRLFAEELSDPNLTNNRATSHVTIGTPSDFARVLLPIALPPTPGGYGSLWVTELTAFADVAEEFRMFPLSYFCPITCPAPDPFGEGVPVRTTFHPNLQLDARQPNPGYLLYMPREVETKVSFQLRIRDTSRELQTWGTEIPVVRESELRTERTQLLDVPVGATFRQWLRVYDADARSGSRVAVRVYGGPHGDVLLAEKELTLTVPANNNTASVLQLPVRPGFAQLMIGDAFPEAAGQTTVRLEITPLTSPLRYWAFVSVTNNDTQHVTTITQ